MKILVKLIASVGVKKIRKVKMGHRGTIWFLEDGSSNKLIKIHKTIKSNQIETNYNEF